MRDIKHLVRVHSESSQLIVSVAELSEEENVAVVSVGSGLL
jgi:hypothetical protein